MRMLIFGAQHPDHVQRLLRRRRKQPRDEMMTEVLAGLGGVLRGRILRFFASDSEVAPADLIQPLATVWQCLAWNDGWAHVGGHQGALGVSMGEAVASVASGAASISAAVRLAEVVSALDRLATGESAMAHVAAPMHEVMAVGRGLSLHPAVHYGRMSSIIGGSATDLEDLAKRCAHDRLPLNRLTLPHAYHTPEVADLEPVFASLGPPLPSSRPKLRLYSCVTGGEIHEFASDHWWSIVGRPCLFAHAVAAALDDGFREFVAADHQAAPLATVHDVATTMGLANDVRLVFEEGRAWKTAG